MSQASSSSAPSPGAERRRWERKAADWPITIALSDGYHEGRLRDISGAGVCFFLDRPIPEMTLLQVQLDLPGQGAGTEEEEEEDLRPLSLRFTGAVVRCQQVSQHLDHYEVAVFLQGVTEEQRERIQAFVQG